MDIIDQLFNRLKVKRESDAALKIMIPDWDLYFNNQKIPSKDISVLLCAELFNCLENITDPINRYVCSGKARKEYINALAENWFEKTDPDERYSHFNGYYGKVVELMTAEWFERNKGKIVDMQAWNLNSPDILLQNGQLYTAVEVKYIPQYKEDYKKQNMVGWLDVKSATNNLLGKFAKINQQLNKVSVNKIAAIVIEKASFAAYFLPLETYNSGPITILGEYEAIFTEASALDKVLIFSNNGFKVEPKYEFNIINKSIVRL
jgi:hypothetical protein